MAERDFIAATRERVVVFDGGMGATLEQFDLSAEDYGGLQGKCHEALVLNRPDVIEGVHASMLEAGAEVVETDTFQGSRLKLEEWGLGEHTLEVNRKAAEIARRAAGEDRFVAGSIGPTGHLPASDDPTLGKITFAELVEVFTEQATGLVAGRRRPDHHRDGAGHPRGQGGRVRRPRGLRGDRPHAADPVQRLPPPPGRQDAARHRHRRGAHDARRARRGRDRAQLLDRARGHARRDPLPRRAQPGARFTASPTPACRCRAPRARRSSPRSPSRWPRPWASSSSATASASSAAAAARRPSTSPRSASGSTAASPASAPPPPRRWSPR